MITAPFLDKDGDLLLYHGTGGGVIGQDILETGIWPRGHKKGNWSHTVEGLPLHTYLTSTYSLYYAKCACDLGDTDEDFRNQEWMVVEVSVPQDEWENLYPDEDAVEQCLRSQEQVEVAEESWDLSLSWLPRFDSTDVEASMNARNAAIKEHMDELQFLWAFSLQVLGNCSYQGRIPREWFRRTKVRKPYLECRNLALAVDPTITIANYYLCGRKYRHMQELFLLGHDL